MKSINLTQAATLKIAEYQYPVITAYELGRAVYELILLGSIQKRPLKLRTQNPERRHYRQVVNALTNTGLLQDLPGVPSDSVFTLFGKDQNTPADQIACRVDPFAYLSHLSAMEFHGLTDRISKTVFISSPTLVDWKDYAKERMRKDLKHHYDEYSQSDFPKLIRTKLHKIRRRPINVFHRKHLGAFRQIKSTGIRVSTIGRTFLDMLREPDLCGGIRHVIGIYREHAAQFARLIIDDVDAHGNAIDKVRMGYVLSEVAGIHDSTIDSWKQFAQRGGSRKLYAKNEYSSTYSEEWCLSLNAD